MASPASAAVALRPITRPTTAPPIRSTVSRPITSASVPNRCRPCRTPQSAPYTGNAVSATGSTRTGPAPCRCSRATSTGAPASAVTPTAAPSPKPRPTAARRAEVRPTVATYNATPVCTLIAGTMPTTSTAISADSSPNEAGTSSRAAATVKT